MARMNRVIFKFKPYDFEYYLNKDYQDLLMSDIDNNGFEIEVNFDIENNEIIFSIPEKDFEYFNLCFIDSHVYFTLHNSDWSINDAESVEIKLN